VCVVVCVSVREHISRTIRNAIFTKFLVHVAYSCGSVLLRQDDEIPRGRGSFGGFFPIDDTLYSIAFETKNGCTDRDAVWVDDSGGPYVPCIRWGPDPLRGRDSFWVT